MLVTRPCARTGPVCFVIAFRYDTLQLERRVGLGRAQLRDARRNPQAESSKVACITAVHGADRVVGVLALACLRTLAIAFLNVDELEVERDTDARAPSRAQSTRAAVRDR